ncbi:MAG: hypothetical protein HC933_02900 [Pleurocapsa sp. SU_196_0]|nr:hypothetical protein [Pleurocapsa sp. SU_196_0]
MRLFKRSRQPHARYTTKAEVESRTVMTATPTTRPVPSTWTPEERRRLAALYGSDSALAHETTASLEVAARNTERSTIFVS